tara:strand:- start:159 stop:323 length:165 start_codon:yes stop_codon:yes gene_type:complete
MQTEEQVEIEDLKNKDELINEIQAICKANKDNDYCSTYQLKDMIEKTFKLWGYH